ncbi:hypothetical protein PIB30_006627 [Stylosanthes scabra]|uniref:RRM domain-containing protein n=1 Tax=Stylosanthes scabra TaxID=79078 RepID=A0ABU6Q4C5_9FABA|nr:hypothetical protein [Stylosanthes scabra]
MRGGWRASRVRRVGCFECGKHSEISGYAGRRNKGESVEGLRQVLGGNAKGYGGNWDEPHTVFVDSLPEGISKRVLYVKFGKFGYILDIFISRKVRTKAGGPYAFIRYKARLGADEAIRMMNGTIWENNKLLVTMSKYGRNGGIGHGGNYEGNMNRGKKNNVTQKWVEMRRKTVAGKEGRNEGEIATSSNGCV